MSRQLVRFLLRLGWPLLAMLEQGDSRHMNKRNACIDALMLLKYNLIVAKPLQVCHGLPQKWPALESEIPNTIDGDVPFAAFAADVFANSLSEPTEPTLQRAQETSRNSLECTAVALPELLKAA